MDHWQSKTIGNYKEIFVATFLLVKNTGKLFLQFRFGISMDIRPLRNVTISTASCDIGIQFGSLVMLEFVARFMYMFQGFPSKRRPVTPDSRMGFGVSATIGRSPMSKVEKVNGCRAEINLKIGR